MALAGGGPLGAIYEIGALLALADSLDGLDLNSLDVYVGVSSGSFVAAGLANGISPAQMYRLFIVEESDGALSVHQAQHGFAGGEVAALGWETHARTVAHGPASNVCRRTQESRKRRQFPHKESTRWSSSRSATSWPRMSSRSR